MTKALEKLINWILIILIGLIPLFFLPFTSEFYEFNKNILLLVVSGLLLVVWVLKMVLDSGRNGNDYWVNGALLFDNE